MDKTNWISSKIMSKDALLRFCNAQRTKGKTIVFTNGCFDILHRGHLELMAKAASLGDILVVGLNSDSSVKRLKGDSRPINNQDDRSFQLASLLFVHAVCLFEEDTPEQLIKDLNPNVLVKGGDYTVDQIAGADFVIQQGGSVSIIPIVDGYATTKLIDKIKNK